MYHSITIGESILSPNSCKNTWTDWHLIPASRPVVNPPPPNIKRIAIPGGDGTIDLSEVIAGRVTYGERTGSWDFYVDNDHEVWATLYSRIMNFLHGKYCQCILEDDPLYYYEGRFSVNEWRSDPCYSRIVINYVLGPYKMLKMNDEFWDWDTFSFGDPNVQGDLGDKIISYKNIKVAANASKNVSISGSYADATINAYTNHPYSTITYKGTTYTLKDSIYNTLEHIKLENGSNTVTLNFSPPTVKKYNQTRKVYENKPLYDDATFSLYITGGIL